MLNEPAILASYILWLHSFLSSTFSLVIYGLVDRCATTMVKASRRRSAKLHDCRVNDKDDDSCSSRDPLSYDQWQLNWEHYEAGFSPVSLNAYARRKTMKWPCSQATPTHYDCLAPLNVSINCEIMPCASRAYDMLLDSYLLLPN